ncbi:uncharacterized protein LOC109838375 [Asparagus officinalis]|uniref:uncharacterized protein LOC109838375 n=1 Tax=Asparagus officinalis TaxID=4686 RepID=UPI00098E17F5|nr:uncharacterized protein LOC109838375 [Asparagus officinalis]
MEQRLKAIEDRLSQQTTYQQALEEERRRREQIVLEFTQFMSTLPQEAQEAYRRHFLSSQNIRALSPTDFIRSRAVCRSWFVAATNETRRNKPCTPLLLLAGDAIDENSEYRTIFSLSDDKTYRFHLPQIRDRRCVGSADSWLVTVDDVAELHLFNPFTGAEHDLPSITTLSVIQGVERDAAGGVTGYIIHAMPRDAESWLFHDLEYMLKYFHTRAVVFAASDDPSSITVFIVYSDYRDLAFARFGDDRWTELNAICPYSFFTDVALHKGQYYGVVSGAGHCVAFDISSSPPRMTFVGPPNHGGTVQRFYLVESLDGDLLQIWRHESWVTPDGDYDGELSSGRVRETQGFTVFRLDPKGRAMVRLERLEEGTALFLGDNRSTLLKTRELPELKENCIYFTDGESEQYISHRRMRRDVGVFNMKDGAVQPLYPRDSPTNRLAWPPPVWLTTCSSSLFLPSYR